jgi:hypothetical protein
MQKHQSARRYLLVQYLTLICLTAKEEKVINIFGLPVEGYNEKRCPMQVQMQGCGANPLRVG